MNSAKYVPMRLKNFDTAAKTRMPIANSDDCDHIESICTVCADTWAEEWEIFYNRTVGGRKLLSELSELGGPDAPLLVGAAGANTLGGSVEIELNGEDDEGGVAAGGWSGRDFDDEDLNDD